MKPKNLKVYRVLPYILLSVIVMLAANCKSSLFDWPPALNQDPVALFKFSDTVPNVEFNAGDSFDPDGEIVCYYWNFGDGSNGEGVHIFHNYKDPGTYFVELRVKDDDDAEATIVQDIPVFPGNIPPIAILSVNATSGNLDFIWKFDGSASYDPDGYIVSYQFDIIRRSDGKLLFTYKGNRSSIPYSFDKAQLPMGKTSMNLKIELTVWDNREATANDYKIITVTEL